MNGGIVNEQSHTQLQLPTSSIWPLVFVNYRLHKLTSQLKVSKEYVFVNADRLNKQLFHYPTHNKPCAQVGIANGIISELSNPITPKMTL